MNKGYRLDNKTINIVRYSDDAVMLLKKENNQQGHTYYFIRQDSTMYDCLKGPSET